MFVTPSEIDTLEQHFSAYEQSTKAVRLIVNSWAENGHDLTRVPMADIVRQLAPKEIAAIGASKSVGGLSTLDIFLSENPQLFIPLGFDELRVEPRFGSLAIDAFETALNSKAFDSQERKLLESHLGLWCRDLASGVWYWYRGFDGPKDYMFRFETSDGLERYVPFDEMVSKCRRSISSHDNPAALLLPALWYPPQKTPHIELVDTTKQLITTLAATQASFDQLSWQQLEDIVAELLRSRGLRVTVTNRSADGGRDVIAKGELLPGEPTTLAVEVKHQDVVKVDSVRSRLYANRHFPMLMLVTSGRFSAGVVKEKKQPDNFLRLILKNGIALRSWINEYAAGSFQTRDV